MTLFSPTCRLVMPFFLLALAIRLLISVQDIAYLDRLFLPDDTYYTLAISKHLFFNHEILTSGFQPLITLFQLPIFIFTEDLDTAVKASVLISAMIGAVSTLLLGVLLAQISTPAASRFAMLFFAISPAILINDLNGLETALTGLLSLLVCLIFYFFIKKPTIEKAILLGVSCSLALLSRIDSVFLVFFIGLGLLYAVGVRWTFWVVFSALVTILPWWVYLYMDFGSILPESGKAVKQIIEKTPHNSLAAPFALYKLTDLLAIQSLGMVMSLAYRIVFLGFLLYCFYKVRFGQLPLVLKLAIASALCLVLFYTFYLPAYWFFERYFYWVFVVLIILISIALTEIRSTFIRQSLLALCILSAMLNIPLYFSQPKAMPSLNLVGPKGYRDNALAILTNLKDNSHVAAMQSGALNYYAPKGVEVTNLDGVVNQAAYLATKQKTLYTYIKNIGVTHFADWHISRDILIKDTNEQINLACMVSLYSFKQGVNEAALYDIRRCLL